MVSVKFFVYAAALGAVASASPSAVDLAQDIYRTCLQDLSVSCVKPKAIQWMSDVSHSEEIKITEDLSIVRKDNVAEVEVRRLGI